MVEQDVTEFLCEQPPAFLLRGESMGGGWGWSHAGQPHRRWCRASRRWEHAPRPECRQGRWSPAHLRVVSGGWAWGGPAPDRGRARNAAHEHRAIYPRRPDILIPVDSATEPVRLNHMLLTTLLHPCGL